MDVTVVPGHTVTMKHTELRKYLEWEKPAWWLRWSGHVHRESTKTRHQTLVHNFAKYWPIFTTLSLLHSLDQCLMKIWTRVWCVVFLTHGVECKDDADWVNLYCYGDRGTRLRAGLKRPGWIVAEQIWKVLACPMRMLSIGINGDQESRENRFTRKMAVKVVCACHRHRHQHHHQHHHRLIRKWQNAFQYIYKYKYNAMQ